MAISPKLSLNNSSHGVQLITPIRKNMKNSLFSKTSFTRKRFVIETIVDQRKNISRIEHTRHRRTNFIVNLIAGLIASWQPKKPSLHLSDKDLALLPALI